MFCVIYDFSNSNLKNKQYKQETAPKTFKTEIKILANPGLHVAWLGFEQPGPVVLPIPWKKPTWSHEENQHDVTEFSQCFLISCFMISCAGILKCLRHKTWVDEAPHEVKGTNDAVVDTPRRARINSLKQVCQFDHKFYYISYLVRALWLVTLAGRTLLYGSLKFKVDSFAKLFCDLLPTVLNFYST